MNDILFWISLAFSSLLAAFAISNLWQKEEFPKHYRITMTFVILLLPVLGSVIYFKQKYAMAAEAGKLKRRRRR